MNVLKTLLVQKHAKVIAHAQHMMNRVSLTKKKLKMQQTLSALGQDFL